MCRSMPIYCLVCWFSSRFYFACARMSSFDARKKHEFPLYITEGKAYAVAPERSEGWLAPEHGQPAVLTPTKEFEGRDGPAHLRRCRSISLSQPC